MARTTKRGLEYFPFDVDFFQDIRIRKLIKYQGGKAITVYALLLCTIYKNGYYAEWDKELPFIISEQSGYTEAYIQEVIDCCLNIGLLSKELFESAKVLTSKGIQERYRAICSSSRRNCLIDEYNLIGISDEKSPAPQPRQSPAPRPPKKHKEKAPDPATVPVHPADSPASPAPVTPLPSAPYASTVDREVTEMKCDLSWKENVAIRYQLTAPQLDSYLADFALKCDKSHTSLQDARSHFCYWLQKQLDTRPKAATKPSPSKATRQKSRPAPPPVDSAAELRDYLASRGLDPAATDLAKVAAADSAADFAKVPQ